MIYACFDESQLMTLGSMKGKTFKSLDCTYYRDRKLLDARIRINLGQYSIDLNNEEKSLELYYGMEDVAYFECKKVDKKELFVTYCMGSPIKSFMIDEKIIGVHVVRDTISFVDNNYELCIDEGLEIITQDNKYSLVRYGEFFIEEISYRIGEDIEDIYPVKRVIENWMPFEPCRISVSREIIEL